MTRIAVIGAGPAGSYFAHLMAKEGYEVDLFEDNVEVGVPFQCTGIVTRALLDHIELPDKLLLNELKYVKVFSPNGEFIKVKNSDLVIDRIGFDKYVSELAVQSGARLHLRHKFTGFDGKTLLISTPEGEKRITADIVVGADGPNSAVAKATGIFGKREYYIGAQTRMKKAFDKSTYEVHLDVPQFFGWSVPETNGISRVGMGSFKQPNKHFGEVKDKYGEDYDQEGNQGGLIPLYDPKLRISTKIDDMPVYLLGDSATFVKATTGGGIVQGMVGGKVLKDCIMNKKRYERKLKWALKKDLWLHLKIRDILNKFTGDDYNRLVWMLKKPAAQDVLANESRDYPVSFVLKLLLAQPKLLVFAPIVFRGSFSGLQRYDSAVQQLAKQ